MGLTGRRGVFAILSDLVMPVSSVRVMRKRGSLMMDGEVLPHGQPLLDPANGDLRLVAERLADRLVNIPLQIRRLLL
jgi:hypothetical protein